MSVAAPHRPVLRYHGGKYALRRWVLAHLPAHRIYTEAFGGAASILLAKPRAYSEVYNDLDGDVVNLFRVLREPGTAEDLTERLRLTPYARVEFEAAFEPTDDAVEAARRLVVRSFLGFANHAASAAQAGFRTPATAYRSGKYRPTTGFRAQAHRNGTVPAHDWASYPDALAAITARLRGVTVESRDAAGVLAQQDHPEALHYVDPPYVSETRGEWAGRAYRHEMSEEDHRALAEVLHGLDGMVVLSGYACPLYDAELYPDWKRVTRRALADGARERVEVLWLNPAAAARQRQPNLFAA